MSKLNNDNSLYVNYSRKLVSSLLIVSLSNIRYNKPKATQQLLLGAHLCPVLDRDEDVSLRRDGIVARGMKRDPHNKLVHCSQITFANTPARNTFPGRPYDIRDRCFKWLRHITCMWGENRWYSSWYSSQRTAPHIIDLWTMSNARHENKYYGNSKFIMKQDGLYSMNLEP